MRRIPLLLISAALAGCPPTDELDMGAGFDMARLDKDVSDGGDTDMGRADMSPDADADVPDAGSDLGPDLGPDAGACDAPPAPAPPDVLPSEGYAGCYGDRFQIEMKPGLDPAALGFGDVLQFLPGSVSAALENDLNTGALDPGWWDVPPMTVDVVPVTTMSDRFWQAEFRDADGALTAVRRPFQCAVIERVIAAVDGVSDDPATALASRFNIGRACPVVALGVLDDPSLDMRGWHLQSMGVPVGAANMPPLSPAGPTPGATQGARVVIIDSGIDPQLVEPLGVEVLPPAADLPEGALNPHGSAMAILVRQLAPNAKLQSLRILGPDNVGAIPDLARGLETALFAGGACDGERVAPDTCQTCAEPDQDADADGWCNAEDNCPERANPDQADADGDGQGDACDAYHCVPTGEDGCDGLDNDCDGQTDEAPLHACAAGTCAQVAACQDGLPVCLDAQASTLEVCDGVAQECSAPGVEAEVPAVICAVEDDWCRAGRTRCTDGETSCQVDPALSCSPACNRDELGRPCFVEGQGRCAGGLSVCRNGQLACEPVWQPTALDRCGDGDTDCDGAVDEDASSGPCVTELPGACAVGNWVCTPEGSACLPTPAEEICNGLDDDCNGVADDGIDCTTCCDIDGQHRTLALAACPAEQRRDADQCQMVCCADPEPGMRAAGDCAAVNNDEGACDVCCVDGQVTAGGDPQQPLIVNLSLGWPPELSQPRRLTGDPGPMTQGGECSVVEAPVGESVRWMLQTLADIDTDSFPISVYAAAGNRPGRARVGADGATINPLADVYTALFQVDRNTPVTDACQGVQVPRPSAPFWFLPGGYARTPSCFDGPFSPRYLTMGLGGISDTDLPTVQSISGAQAPLVAPGQHVYVDHPALARRQAICELDEAEEDRMFGPMPFTGTSVPTALASGLAARAMAIREAEGQPAMQRRAQFRLMYFTGRPVDAAAPNQARVADFGGYPVHRLDMCRLQFALSDARCAPLRACIEEAGGPDPLTPCSQPNALACLADAEVANGGPCSERPRAAVPVNPDYVPEEPCRDARICPQTWSDAVDCNGPCPFEIAPDRHSLGTLSGTPTISGCPDCFVNPLKGRFEVLINIPFLDVISATLYYDQAPHDMTIKWQALPTGYWYKGDTFTITDLAAYKGNVCPSYAKLQITHKDADTGKYISDISPIRVVCKP